MSYQPPMNRPPFTMPPLPPGIPPPAFTGFPPLPPGTQMPMTMTMQMGLPPATVSSVVTTSSSSASSMRRQPLMNDKAQPSTFESRRPPFGRKMEHDPNKPKTTVFVGNISERASDVMIRQMLSRCGTMVSWKRVQGASGKLQAFGFCEYADPEGSLRAIRLLHDKDIGDKKLVVKVDAKTREQLDEYLSKKRSNNGGDGKDLEDGLDPDTVKKDRIFKVHLENIMREHASELNKSTNDEDGEGGGQKKKKTKEKEKKEDEKIDDMEMDEDKKNLISREIRVFRDSHKICR